MAAQQQESRKLSVLAQGMGAAVIVAASASQFPSGSVFTAPATAPKARGTAEPRRSAKLAGREPRRFHDLSIQGEAARTAVDANSENAAEGATAGVLAGAAATCAGTVAALGKKKARKSRKGRQEKPDVVALRSTATMPTSAPLPSTAAPSTRAPDAGKIFEALWQNTASTGRVVADLPGFLPMGMLSAKTAVPVLTVAAAVACPSPTLVARAIAGGLGCIMGSATGSFLERAKTDASRSAILRILADNMQNATALEERERDPLRARIDQERRRFNAAADQAKGEAFEDSALQDIYYTLLSQLVDDPQMRGTDLPTLQRLKAVLALDGIVVGNAHKRAAQVLMLSRAGSEDEELQRAVDKLLYLSDCAFSDDEPEESRLFEMARVRKALKIDAGAARRRITNYSRALYQQTLSEVVDKVDAHTAEVLVNASKVSGLGDEDAAEMNAATYREIAADLLQGGSLSEEGRNTLGRAREVLQLGERTATSSFVSVASPIFLQDVKTAATTLKTAAKDGVKPTDAQVQEAVATLERRREELALPAAAADAVAAEGFMGELKSIYAMACKQVRREGADAEDKAMETLDALLAFAPAADKVLAAVHTSGQSSSSHDEDAAAEQAFPLVYPADQNTTGRLYGVYLKRDLLGKAPASAVPSEEMVRLLDISEEDRVSARVEVCQPLLQKYFEDSIEKAASGKAPLGMAKLAMDSELKKYQLPAEAVEECAMAVYRKHVELKSGKIISDDEAQDIDAVRNFLNLAPADVRKVHLKAFGPVYKESVEEGIGRGNTMADETRQALEKLRERLGLSEEDAQRMFLAAIEDQVKDMMEEVVQAWEDATYSKEALAQVRKNRGQDLGDDPYSDGTGAMLGITEDVPLEGVRGFKFMVEATKVADFYCGNKVFDESKEPGDADAYPVTVGKFLEDKIKEEMYGIYAWNALTCQEAGTRETWSASKAHVGGILGLEAAKQQKVMARMVSRWSNMFIKQKMSEQGELSDTDVSTLTEWAPTFFGIDEKLTKDMVKGATQGMLLSKAMVLVNSPTVALADIIRVREDCKKFGVSLEKDLELTKPQLRSLFRVQVSSALEDPSFDLGKKREAVTLGRGDFGLAYDESQEELQELLKHRTKGCLVNAAGDKLQGNSEQAVKEMQRFELLVGFAEADKISLDQDWEVSPSMREELLKLYSGSGAQGQAQGGSPAVPRATLDSVLGLQAA
eukprot:TRINITY_DN8569_c0_g1_i2.p1 TRINITY_DN8569_c0_g1~~TRINITY_DN8569_c0_g1_i2.p1  ORF type:complete len:1207 (-),score=439.76 TRINITY_DN8569_c0_g1_i2:499-4119(-)